VICYSLQRLSSTNGFNSCPKVLPMPKKVPSNLIGTFCACPRGLRQRRAGCRHFPMEQTPPPTLGPRVFSERIASPSASPC